MATGIHLERAQLSYSLLLYKSNVFKISNSLVYPFLFLLASLVGVLVWWDLSFPIYRQEVNAASLHFPDMHVHMSHGTLPSGSTTEIVEMTVRHQYSLFETAFHKFI